MLIAVGASSPFISVDGDETSLHSELTGPTSPLLSDTDRDGLSDTYELNSRTEPEDYDTDGDNLSDGPETSSYGTDPTQEDTDRDSLTDYKEIKIHTTNPSQNDTDRDNISDYTEVQRGTDPITNQNCSDHSEDNDKDNLSDYTECRIGTDKEDVDTDNDGLTDYEESVSESGEGTEIPSSRPTHMDLYVFAIQTGNNTIDTSEIRSVFRERQVSNPNNTDGIRIHIKTVEEEKERSVSSVEEFRDLRKEYLEKYPEYFESPYTVAVIGNSTREKYSGRANAPGQFAFSEPSTYVFAHEVLHTRLGEIPQSECDEKSHTCSENGLRNKKINTVHDNRFSNTTLNYIESEGFTLERRDER